MINWHLKKYHYHKRPTNKVSFFLKEEIMAVEVVETKGLWKKLQGISTDNKPVDDINGTLRIGNGSEFYELDTGKTFIYSIGNADQASSHWWKK